MKKIILVAALMIGLVSAVSAQKNVTETGVKVSVDAGFIRGSLLETELGNMFDNVIDASGTVGYQFNKTLMVGVGAGVQYIVNDERFFIPTFVNAHVNFAEGLLIPYFGFKAGYAFDTDSGAMNGNYFVTPSIGIKLQNKLSVSLGYNYQWFDISNWRTVHNQGVVAKVGWMF